MNTTKSDMISAYIESRKNSIYESFETITEDQINSSLFENAYQLANKHTEKEIRLALSMHMAMKRKNEKTVDSSAHN